MKQGSSILAIIFAVAAFVALIIGLVFFANHPNEVVKGTGGGRGCVLADEYFKDTSIADNPEATFNLLVTKYSATTEVRDKVLEVLAEGKKRGINPAMPLAVWNGEQSFGSPEKAFGYGYRDSGTISGVTAWNKQLEGVYKTLGDAIGNKGNYTQPTGTNIYTRFFYNYTTAMRDSYLQNNNVWDASNSAVAARLAVLQLLVPSQVLCATASGTSAPNVVGISKPATTGHDGVPYFSQNDNRFEDVQVYPGKSFHVWGCCPTSAAMVIRYYGVPVDPLVVAKVTIDRGYYKGNGTIHGAGWLKALGETYKLPKQEVIPLRADGTGWDKVIRHLSQRHPLILRGDSGRPFGGNGHCIVLTGYDPVTRMVNINNPAPALGTGPYSIDELKTHGRRAPMVAYYLGK